MKPTKDASIIVLTFHNRVLLILRDNKPNIASPNMWCFPGGVKEENETFKEACIRETKEELNLSLDKIDFLVNIKYENRSKYFYHADLTEELAKSIIFREGQKYEYFKLKELSRLKLAKSSALFITEHAYLLKRLLE